MQEEDLGYYFCLGLLDWIQGMLRVDFITVYIWVKGMRHLLTPCTITTTAVVKGRRTLPILIAPFTTSTYFLKEMEAPVKQLIQTVLFASYKCYKNCTVWLEVRIKLFYFSTPAHNAKFFNTVDSLKFEHDSKIWFNFKNKLALSLRVMKQVYIIIEVYIL